MKTRISLLAATLLVTAGAGYASAAPKPKPKPKPKPVPPVCNLVLDDKGDAKYNGAVPGNEADDITSADLASDATNITGVLRLAGLAESPSQAPLGRSYSVLFTVTGSPDLLYLAARTYPQGTKYVYGYQALDPATDVNTNYMLGDATGVVDTAKNEVRISAPIKGFIDGAKAKMAPKVLLKDLQATVDRIAGQGFVASQSFAPGTPRVPLGGFLFNWDKATGTLPYAMSAPSCVPVGK